MAKKKLKSKKKKKKILSAAEKATRGAQRKLHRDFRNFMRKLGFAHLEVDEIEIQVQERTGELDDIFIYENVIVITEYTVGKVDSSHILKKKPLYDKIQADVPNFLTIAREKYPKINGTLKPIYDDGHYHLRILYIPLFEAAEETIATVPNVVFLQGGLKKYFFALGKTLQRSGRIEFFSYLRLGWSDVGEGTLAASTKSHDYAGQLLPETMSSFPAGFKVVSFYADPESLIAGAYVLRRDGWRDSSHLYQRILVSSKIKKMRRYLVDQKRVFVNNVIITLPSETSLNDPQDKGTNIPEKDLNKARPVIISIPVGYSVMGIIDGQHRVFCYHEGDDELEEAIAILRKKQHLLVTGIIYPHDIKEKQRLEFEARLFLEINDTQTRARPALRQDIETIVRPFSGIAVARRVIAEVAKNGPYARLFQLAYFDSPSKIKTSSIVSYGLRPLVKFDGDDSLFSAWKDPNKERLKAREKKPTKAADYEQDIELLEKYIEFCVKNINDFLLAAKLSYGGTNWDVDAEQPSPLLRPTSINGLIACLRRVILNGMPLSLESHKKRMDFSGIKFGNYKSSQWDTLGETLFEEHYNNSGS